MSSSNASNIPQGKVRKHYARVVVVWLVTLIGLYALQQYFN